MKAARTILGAIVFLLMPLSTVGASGVTVGCGSTITSSIVLQSDLNCASNGLIVGADGIVINLNGHQIVGANSSGTAGILVNRHDGVEITGGGSLNSVIRDFAIDVQFLGGRSGSIDSINLDGNGWGLAFNGTQFASAQNISTQAAAGGIWVTGVGNSIVDSSIMSVGIGILGPGGNTTTSLTKITGNGFFSNKVGIQLEGRALRNVISNNTFRHTQTSILLGPMPTATATAVENNEFIIDDQGINLGNASGTSVVNNSFDLVTSNLLCGTATGSVFSGNNPSSVDSQCPST